MKEPSLPYRQKKPPSVQKLKLLCSFNGAFRSRPPSGRFRYVGGESRIISIDRSAGISRLLLKLSSLCPESPSLAIIYQLSEPGLCYDRDRDGPPLVSLITDDDVRHMVEEYDRAVSGGKNARLRIFVICSENEYVRPYSASASPSSSSSGSNVNTAAFPACNVFGSKFSSTDCIGFGSQSKIATSYAGVQSSQDRFLQTACRPQISTAPQMVGIQKAGDFLASDASRTGIGSAHFSFTQRPGDSSSQTTARPQILITNMTRNKNFAADSCIVNNFRPPKPIAYVSGGRLSGFSPRPRESQSLAHERRFASSRFNQLIRVEFPHQIYDSRTVEHACMEDLNRENICPRHVASPFSHCSELGRKAAPSRFLVRSDGISSNPSCMIGNHGIGTGNFRQNQIGQCDARRRRNGPHDNCRYGLIGFELKPCYGKINAGLRPRSDISKIGQTRSHQVRFSKAWHGAHGHGGEDQKMANSAFQETPYLLGYENEDKMKASVGQPTASRLPVSTFSFRQGLHEKAFGISNFGKNRVQQDDLVGNGSSTCHMSSPPYPPRVEEQPQSFGAGTMRKNVTCNENHVFRETESNPICSDYFSSSNHFLGAYPCGFPCPKTSKPGSDDLSVELSPNASSNERNVDATVMLTYSVTNTQRKDVAIPGYSDDQCQNNWLEPMNNKMPPLYDEDTHASLFSGIHEKVSVRDFGCKCIGQHNRTPLDHSIRNLSLLSLTEATIASSSDDLGRMGGGSEVRDQNIANGTETYGQHMASWDWKLENQCGEIDPVGSRLGLVTKDWTEDGKDRRDDGCCLTIPSDASIKDVPDLVSLLKSSDSTMENLSIGRENELTAPSKPGMDKEANGETSGCSSEVVDQPSNAFVRIDTRLATEELQTIKNSDLEEIRELGSGTYGSVFYGKWKGSDVAIKRIKPSCFEGDVLGDDKLIAEFWKEAHLLGQLHHPNVVAFYGVVRDGPAVNLATVTEYMVNGSLKQVLQRKDRTIDRHKRIIIAMDAAFGMEYLHEKNIVHFDLKSHNFLVNMRDPQRPVCKIGDLGLSKVKQKTLISGGVRGTIPWMAPELLSADKSTMVTEKVDVFSFGIVMWELLTGEEPYADMRSEEIIGGILKGSLRPVIPSWCDPAWSSLMERCWSSNPVSRPSFSEIAKELRSMSASMNVK